ncbi:FMN-binding protein [Spirillospora albida]|uniref:FMN-binding protein n=1 Tax=Spirillospora albida TaxID=58123 RepID=UPI0004BF9EF5|nr:FMN-binding protein [Spirillospora albida]
MRRTSAAVIGTVTSAALIFAAKLGADAVETPDTGQTASGDLAPAAEAPAPASKAPASRAPGGKAPARRIGLKDGVFKGAASVNQYGPIQVTIRVAGGKITALRATHATTPATTRQVNTRAIPVLRQEALSAQSAQVDTVSGATFTSGSFRTSLQSALAAARR